MLQEGAVTSTPSNSGLPLRAGVTDLVSAVLSIPASIAERFSPALKCVNSFNPQRPFVEIKHRMEIPCFSACSLLHLLVGMHTTVNG